MRRTLFFLAAACVIALATAACRPVRGTRPLQRCEARCAREASSCDEDACARGCAVTVDREVEGASSAVFRCVTVAKDCSERAFAKCGARQGIHADGGPPIPASIPDDD